MGAYEVQFTIDDVVAKVNQVIEDENSSVPAELSHRIQGTLVNIKNCCVILADWKYKFDDLVQRAYVNNIKHIANELYEIIQTLFDEGKLPEEVIKKKADTYIRRMKEIETFLPALPVIEGIGEITEKQREYCESIDFETRLMVYIANNTFAPHPENSRYFLLNDFKEFKFNTDKLFRRSKIELHRLTGGIYMIETAEDYMTKAIMELVMNAKTHAFNPENDIYGREGSFNKIIEVGGMPPLSYEKETGIRHPDECGLYTVQVIDNGFGMTEEQKRKCFDQYFTTRESKKGHGIGLWGVKEFIESMGGSIKVESTIGIGSRFVFTIPYQRTEGKIGIQERTQTT